MKNRYIIKIAGESGQGINSVGEILGKTLKNSGYNIFGYREYPSLIKGGHASYQIDISNKPISSSSKFCNILFCVSRVSVHAYINDISEGGILIHNLKSLKFSEDEKSLILKKRITVEYIDLEEHLKSISAPRIMANTLALGIISGLIPLEKENTYELLKDIFGSKGEEIIEMNKRCLDLGYDLAIRLSRSESLPNIKNKSTFQDYLLTGNDALGIGSYAAGVRAYFAYPMTPSSSILTYLANIKDKTKMLVRQVDDEITAAQMMVGAMFMGTRALTGTSGGGFDLMTETLSLVGITETPAVFIIGQRPGPATGLPTWTAQGDLNLALYSGHGEYPRCVIAVSDASDCYLRIQEAFNMAEEFQIPVLVLTDKQIAESLFQVDTFPDDPEIIRGLVKTEEIRNHRFSDSKTGISERWLPGESDKTYLGNSDEHTEDGSLTEDGELTKIAMEKRMRKEIELEKKLAQPEFFGDEESDILFIGWGSSKGVLLDLIGLGLDLKISYLHFTYLNPLKTSLFLQKVSRAKRVILIENNYLGQLGNYITQKTGYEFSEKLLKYDGRPFFLEDILEYLGVDMKEQSSSKLFLSLN